MSLFDISLSGMKAAQFAQLLTANNVANASNPFYTRRGVDFVEAMGGHFSGVKLGDVRRVFSDVHNQQLLNASFQAARSETFYDKMSYLESYFDNEDTSVIRFIEETQKALESLNASPASMEGRNHYLNQLQNMAARLHDADKRLETEFNDNMSEISNEVEQVNDILENIADLNKIILSQSGQDEASQLALYDQREQSLADLGKLIDFDAHIKDNGEVELLLDNGIPLITDATTAKLTIIQGAEASDIQIGIESSTGVTNIDRQFKNGALRGALDYNQELQVTQYQLDRITLTIADRLNRQNQLGIDANAELGGLIFTDINDPSLMTNRVSADSHNTGNASMDVVINSPEVLKDSDYEIKFDNATDYHVVRRSDGQTVTSGSANSFPHTISLDGFSVDITAGSFDQNDSYIISPLKASAQQIDITMRDGAKLALGSPINTSASKNNQGTGSIELTSVVDTSNAAFSLPKHLNPPIRVEFINSTTYNIIDANTNAVIEDNLTYDPVNGSDLFPSTDGFDPGYRIHLQGDIQSGDIFNIDYNTSGQGDNRNGLLLADLYTKTADFPGFTGLYKAFEFNISSAVSSAKLSFDSDNIILEQAQARRDETSAVSLSEEMMNMSRYQEFYMANAKVMDTLNETMTMLFGLLGR